MAIIRQNIGSAQIVDGSVVSADIADNSVTTAKIVDANITSDKVATDAITAAKIADSAVTTAHMHSSVPLGTKNLIINGAMQVWQRGTSFNVTSAQYTADRWQTQGQIWTGTSSTDVPDDFQYSLDITSGSSSYGTFGQKIEAVNCKHLVGKTVTLSFYAKAVSGVTNCYVLLKVPSAEDNWSSSSNAVSAQNISDIGSTWTKHSFTFTNLPSSVANGLLVVVFHEIGQTTQRRFTGFQLEVGDTATPFEHRPYDMELARCQRYYEHNYNIGQIPGSIPTYPAGMGAWLNGFGTHSGQKGFQSDYKVTKRATPAVTFYDTAGNSAKASILNAGGTTTDNQPIAIVMTGTSSILGVAGDGTHTGVHYFWVADSEL